MDGSQAEIPTLVGDNSDDGEFFMHFDDLIQQYSKLSICHDFPDEYNGLRFKHEWTKDNCGGVPFNNTDEQRKAFCKNTQFRIRIKPEAGNQTNIVIALEQPDGRMQASERNQFPFRNSYNPIIMLLFRLPEGQEKTEGFDGNNMMEMTAITSYKQTVLNLNLAPGGYTLVPTCQHAGLTGQYFLHMYFNCPRSAIEIENLETSDKGAIIEEEEENLEVDLDKDVRNAIQLKAGKMIFIDNQK